MSIVSRVQRHTQLSLRAREHRDGETPPFLIVFINSICNLTCEHCFYWKELNQRNDLSFADFEQLTSDLGQFDTLNLSGGEPFIRADFGEICGLFITKNGVKQIYVPTNGYFTAKCEKSLRKVLAHKSLDRFVCEISLDGMPEYHNRFRGNPKSFEKAMETYAMLAKLQDEDPRLRIHVNTVAMSENIGEVWRSPSTCTTITRASSTTTSPSFAATEKILRSPVRRSSSTSACTRTSARCGRTAKTSASARSSSRCCST